MATESKKKKGGDKTPNQLYKNIVLSNGATTDYTETGTNEFSVPEGSEEVNFEQHFIAEVQDALDQTAGTDHNLLMRRVSFLNYVHKQAFPSIFKAPATDDRPATYFLPVSGGYYHWPVDAA